jgi:hypothetical protein
LSADAACLKFLDVILLRIYAFANIFLQGRIAPRKYPHFLSSTAPLLTITVHGLRLFWCGTPKCGRVKMPTK